MEFCHLFNCIYVCTLGQTLQIALNFNFLLCWIQTRQLQCLLVATMTLLNNAPVITKRLELIFSYKFLQFLLFSFHSIGVNQPLKQARLHPQDLNMAEKCWNYLALMTAFGQYSPSNASQAYDLQTPSDAPPLYTVVASTVPSLLI